MTKEAVLEGQRILIDKPYGWSSFQALNKVKWAIRKKFDLNKKFKIGHAGTLDPLATGLLLICTGKFTKKIPELQGQIKEYTGTFTLGGTTPSYDLETEIEQTFPISHLTEEKIHGATKDFVGKIEQKPPLFSAIKKDGKRLYEFARKGETVEIKSRTIEIFEFEITHIAIPNINFRVVCSRQRSSKRFPPQRGPEGVCALSPCPEIGRGSVFGTARNCSLKEATSYPNNVYFDQRP